MRVWLAAVLLGAMTWISALPAKALDLKTFEKSAPFDDVKFDLANAITNRGLVADFTGNVGGMLARTGQDVGSTVQIYKHSEYVVFCSARLSREMMEADAANAGYCPFVMFLYETAAAPGKVVVGYRRFPQGGNEASRKAFAAIEALLDGIAKEAVK